MGLETFFGHSTIAIGGQGWARKVIDINLGREPPGIADSTFAKVLAARTNPAAAWVAARFDSHQQAALAAGPLGVAIAELHFDLDVADGVTAHLQVNGVSERDSAQRQKRLSELLAHVRQDPAIQAMGVSDLVDRVAVAAQGQSLAVSLRLSAVEVSRIVERLEKATQRRGPISAGDPI